MKPTAQTRLGLYLTVLVAALAIWPLDAPAQPATDEATAEMSASDRRARQAVDRALADEPPVAEVRRQALRAQGYDAGDLDRWSSRARWSHLLPDVQGEVAWLDQRDKESRYREDIDTDDRGQMLRDSARNDFIDDNRLRTIYAVKLKWDLSGLVFDRSETTIAREVRQRRKARRELLAEVGEAYYLRRRYLAEWMITPRSEWRQRMELRLEADRQTAHLDAMTGGWFSRTLTDQRQDDPRQENDR